MILFICENKRLECSCGLKWKLLLLKGSLVRLQLSRTQRHRTNRLSLLFHTTSAMMPHAPSAIAPLPVLRQNWKTLVLLASRWSKPPDVDACPHTVFIRLSVLRSKPTNLLSLGLEAKTKKPLWWFWGPNHQTIDFGFEAQTKKLSQWFWGKTTNKPSPPVFRLNRETRASRLLNVYDADRTQHHLTSQSYGHRVPDLRLIIPDPPHQVSYSCLDPHHCTPCRIRHLHITSQANVFLHT
jgi:hypothetical protein